MRSYKMKPYFDFTSIIGERFMTIEANNPDVEVLQELCSDFITDIAKSNGLNSIIKYDYEYEDIEPEKETYVPRMNEKYLND